jgi:hypothetical protein
MTVRSLRALVERIVTLPDDQFLALLISQGTKPGLKPPPDLEESPPGSRRSCSSATRGIPTD